MENNRKRVLAVSSHECWLFKRTWCLSCSLSHHATCLLLLRLLPRVKASEASRCWCHACTACKTVSQIKLVMNCPASGIPLQQRKMDPHTWFMSSSGKIWLFVSYLTHECVLPVHCLPVCISLPRR